MIDPYTQLHLVGARSSRVAPGRSDPYFKIYSALIPRDAYGYSRQETFSILFLARLFTGAFASKRGLHTFLLSGLQIEGVSLDLLDNVFLLHLALKAAQSIFEGLSLL
jgi:hypothetical protein